MVPREQVPGLIDPNGYLWPEIPEIYSHATPEQALIEGRAQIKRARWQRVWMSPTLIRAWARCNIIPTT